MTKSNSQPVSRVVPLAGKIGLPGKRLWLPHEQTPQQTEQMAAAAEQYHDSKPPSIGDLLGRFLKPNDHHRTGKQPSRRPHGRKFHY